jgi:glycerophosphoryl diester phosphodiesterase
MPTILSHRGNVHGPDPAGENRLPAIRQALARGWGLEVDIRRAADGRFYVAHDPQPSADVNPAEAVCEALRQYPAAPVALNVKELGDEAALLAFLAEQQVLDQVCLFDMELLEAVPGTTARTFAALDPRVSLAARVSDRGEPIARALAIDVARTIWLDEFDGPWATTHQVARLRALGRAVYAVSPDLHGHSLAVARRRWFDFLDWGVDGICTDYPDALQALLTSLPMGVAV